MLVLRLLRIWYGTACTLFHTRVVILFPSVTLISFEDVLSLVAFASYVGQAGHVRA